MPRLFVETRSVFTYSNQKVSYTIQRKQRALTGARRLTYAVLRQLGDVVEDELVGVAKNVLSGLAGVRGNHTSNLDAVSGLLELGMAAKLVSYF